MTIPKDILEEMLSQAKLGVYYTTVSGLNNEDIKFFHSMGFQVSVPKNYDNIQCQYIKWTYAKASGNTDDLDENDSKYSLAQKLWIITEKSKKNININLYK